MSFEWLNSKAYISLINCYYVVMLIGYFGGGWWFSDCFRACLTCGPWKDGGMLYHPYAEYSGALKAAEMKLKLPWTNSCFSFCLPPIILFCTFCCLFIERLSVPCKNCEQRFKCGGLLMRPCLLYLVIEGRFGYIQTTVLTAMNGKR